MKMRIDQRGRMVSMDFRTFAALSSLGRLVIDKVETDSDAHIALNAVLAWVADDRDSDDINEGAQRFADTMGYAINAVSPVLMKSDPEFCRYLVPLVSILQQNAPVIPGSILDDEGDDDA